MDDYQAESSYYTSLMSSRFETIHSKAPEHFYMIDSILVILYELEMIQGSK
jgi:hypothetical protein